MGLYHYRYRGHGLPVAVFQRLLHFWELRRGRLLAVTGSGGNYQLLIYSCSQELLTLFERYFPVEVIYGDTVIGESIYIDDLLSEFFQCLEGHLPFTGTS